MGCGRLCRHVPLSSPGCYGRVHLVVTVGPGARALGWRIDYFFVTPDLAPYIRDAFILPDVKGSDHCPIGLTLDLPE